MSKRMEDLYVVTVVGKTLADLEAEALRLGSAYFEMPVENLTVWPFSARPQSYTHTSDGQIFPSALVEATVTVALQ